MSRRRPTRSLRQKQLNEVLRDSGDIRRDLYMHGQGFAADLIGLLVSELKKKNENNYRSSSGGRDRSRRVVLGVQEVSCS